MLALTDPLRTRQIVRNLLTNALRYGGSAIQMEVRQSGDMAAIRVIDDGIGVPEPMRERIFDAYQNGSIHAAPGSVGLGLTVSRQLAR